MIKPEGAKGPLPGILGLHDHAGKKYFGKRKITRLAKDWHPMMLEHYDHYYEGVPWANEVAKRGYVVLISDAFPFASRRVMIGDISDRSREGLSDDDPENPENIIVGQQTMNQQWPSHSFVQVLLGRVFFYRKINAP